MSAWSEAVYIVNKVNKALVSEELLQTLKNKHNIISDAVLKEDDKYYPQSYEGMDFTNESLWLVTKEK